MLLEAHDCSPIQTFSDGEGCELRKPCLYHLNNTYYNNTGLPTKDETVDTTVRNLYYSLYSRFPATVNLLLSLQKH